MYANILLGEHVLIRSPQDFREKFIARLGSDPPICGKCSGPKAKQSMQFCKLIRHRTGLEDRESDSMFLNTSIEVVRMV